MGFCLEAFADCCKRFVPEGKEDQVVQMLRALADECKAEVSEESVQA
jgi:hypothetical protein